MKKLSTSFILIIIISLQGDGNILYGGSSHETEYSYSDHGKILFGSYIGLTGSRIYGIEAKKNSIKPGPVFGGFVLYELRENFYFRPEILFSSKGYTYTDKDYDFFKERKRKSSLNLSYIETALLVQFFAPLDAMQVNWTIGPIISYNMSARIKASIKNDIVEDNTDNIRKVDLGLVCGGNFLLSRYICLDLRANIGILPIINTKTPPDIKNISCSIMLGYLF